MTAYPIPQTVSAQARAMLALPPQRPTYPALGDTQGWLAYVAAADDGALAVLPPVSGRVKTAERDVDGVRVYVHRPAHAAGGSPVYLDFHPGALIHLGGEACRRLGGGMAESLEAEVWSVDYRMPPLHPFPAALDDALTVYKALLATVGSERVVVSGVSAGGNIAAALLLRAHEEGLEMPAAMYLGTPEIDLTESGDSFAVNAHADNTLAALAEVNALYAGGEDLTHPHISPLFAEDVAFFPPTMLSTGTRDLFLSNTVLMHRKLRQAGVDAQLHVFEAMPHVGFGPGSPEDLELRRELQRFITSHT